MPIELVDTMVKHSECVVEKNIINLFCMNAFHIKLTFFSNKTYRVDVTYCTFLVLWFTWSD
ncbi:unnamed protein product [Phytomonas sp. Hart1]|nr:unnamed protein product [Phytomonas sp. Hart1]|eukprot:CCW65934.1 unnamed protein product [Phytomonas sp. isolate Hart1]